ncbi:C6 transcription factor [Gigaspora margarita]|uniref:C6 transcription factor n=1 Tax=Gigaspora margarita TaxID=4874 RepID=A0A8H4EI22_GIGMA|nr:C6 transcription factor [Gigaspora margarita]
MHPNLSTNHSIVPSINYHHEDELPKINSNSQSKVIKKARTYVTLACTNCRNKKEKCSGEQEHPGCQNCRKRDRICVYEKSDKKRGPKPKSAITTIITPKLFNLLNPDPVSCT